MGNILAWLTRNLATFLNHKTLLHICCDINTHPRDVGFLCSRHLYMNFCVHTYNIHKSHILFVPPCLCLSFVPPLFMRFVHIPPVCAFRSSLPPCLCVLFIPTPVCAFCSTPSCLFVSFVPPFLGHRDTRTLGHLWPK